MLTFGEVGGAFDQKCDGKMFGIVKDNNHLEIYTFFFFFRLIVNVFACAMVAVKTFAM